MFDLNMKYLQQIVRFRIWLGPSWHWSNKQACCVAWNSNTLGSAASVKDRRDVGRVRGWRPGRGWRGGVNLRTQTKLIIALAAQRLLQRLIASLSSKWRLNLNKSYRLYTLPLGVIVIVHCCTVPCIIALFSSRHLRVNQSADADPLLTLRVPPLITSPSSSNLTATEPGQPYQWRPSSIVNVPGTLI